MNLSKFKVIHEDNKNYHIEHPNGKKMQIDKSKISSKAHELVKKLKGNNYADGGEILDYPIPNSSSIKDSPEVVNQNSSGIPEWEKSSSSVPNSAPTMASSGELQGDNSEQQMPDVTQSVNNTPSSPSPMLPGMTTESSLGEQKAANKALASAEASKGLAEKKAIESVDAEMKNIPSQNEMIAANKAKDDSLFKAYQEQKIDPNRYYHNMGTGSKIAAAIGMVLSGAGSGVTGQQNMAATLIQNAVERDINAQKSDKESKYNLWKMNREALGNDMAANLATQNQIYTGLKYNLMKAESQFKGPEAAARAQAANALLDQQIAQNRFKMSLMNGPSQEQKDPAQIVPWLVPETRQKEVFDEISRAQDTRHMSDSILKSFDDATKENTILRTGAGLIRTPASVLALHQSMQPTFKDLEGTVRQAAMDNTFKNITPSPGDAQHTIDTKREALVDYLNSKKSAPTAKGFGIDLDKYQSTKTPQQLPVERVTQDGQVALFDPSSKQFLGYKK